LGGGTTTGQPVLDPSFFLNAWKLGMQKPLAECLGFGNGNCHTQDGAGQVGIKGQEIKGKISTENVRRVWSMDWKVMRPMVAETSSGRLPEFVVRLNSCRPIW